MSSDDQYFLDLLSSIPNDVKRYSLEVADAIDRSVDQAAAVVRKTLSTFEWIPESARPRPPPLPPRAPTTVNGPRGLLYATRDWISEHRALTAAMVAFVVTGGILVYRRRRSYMKKRRAKRASNGQRTEVIGMHVRDHFSPKNTPLIAAVIAGPPNSPITRSVSLDLERRGFLVYVVVATAEEERLIKSESRADIRPLYLDITNPFDAQDTVENFRRLLANPYHSPSGPPTQSLQFAGLIVIPDLTYPAGPVETISPELWSDMLNVKVLGTIITTQAFLGAVRDCKARVLFMSPAVIPSLLPAFHSVQSAVVRALEGFTSSLSAELGTMSINVCHFKLGAFNLVKETTAAQRAQLPRESDVMSWTASARAVYGRNYFSLCDGLRRHHGLTGASSDPMGSTLRELNNAVFDALTQKHPRRVWHIGKGSLLYEIVGSWVPSGIVGWMMGLRTLSSDELDNAKVADSVQSLQWEKIETMA